MPPGKRSWPLNIARALAISPALANGTEYWIETTSGNIVRDRVPSGSDSGGLVFTKFFEDTPNTQVVPDTVWRMSDPVAVEATVGTLPRAMYASWNMMMGSFDAVLLDDSYYPTLAYAVYFEYIVLVNIVLLNLLIALMGGSYEKVAEKATRETMKQRAELIVGYEQTMSKAQLANKQWHPTYVFALLPADGDEAGEGMEEAGVVNGVRRLLETCRSEFMPPGVGGCRGGRHERIRLRGRF